MAACECGQATGRPCDGAATESILWVPPYQRGTATAAGTWDGVAIRLRVSEECAEMIAEHDGEWTEAI